MPSLGRMKKRIAAINNAKDIEKNVKEIMDTAPVFGRVNRRRYAQELKRKMLDDLVHVAHKS